jgi:hypothetical protein
MLVHNIKERIKGKPSKKQGVVFFRYIRQTYTAIAMHYTLFFLLLSFLQSPCFFFTTTENCSAAEEMREKCFASEYKTFAIFATIRQIIFYV